MKHIVSLLVISVLGANLAWSAPVEPASSFGKAVSGSFVNGTWDIKDNNGNKTGTVTINKAIGESGTITVTDTAGNTYTGTVDSAGSGNISYSLTPAGSPLGSSGTIVQTATPGTLSFNNFDIPGTDADGTLSH